MGYRKIETLADLDAALKAWARWKARGEGGYPSMDTIARVREARLGGAFGSRIPPMVDMPWGVELCVQGLEWMKQTPTGTLNVAAIQCKYLLCHLPPEDQIEYLQEIARESSGDPDLKINRNKYYDRVRSAREQLLDWIQRRDAARQRVAAEHFCSKTVPKC